MRTVISTLAAILILVAIGCRGGSAAIEWKTVAFEEHVLRVDAVVPDEYYPALRTRSGQHIHNIMGPDQKSGYYDPNLPSFLLYADTYDSSGEEVRFTAHLPLVTFLTADLDYKYKPEDVLVCFNTKNPDLPWDVGQFCRAPKLAE